MNNFRLPTSSQAIWRVFIEVKSGFNPVSMLWYASIDYQDAFDYLETRQHLITRKRRIFVKQVGNKHRHFHFDPKFYAEILAREDVDSDEYYEEDTTDEKVIAQLKRPDRHGFKPAIWRDIRREPPRQKPENDDYLVVLFIDNQPPNK